MTVPLNSPYLPGYDEWKTAYPIYDDEDEIEDLDEDEEE